MDRTKKTETKGKWWYCVEYRKQGRVIQERFKDQTVAFERVKLLRKAGQQCSGGRVPRRPLREALSHFKLGLSQALTHLRGAR